MAESDVLEGELISGLQAGDDDAQDNIEHPSMLYSRSCNRIGDKADKNLVGTTEEMKCASTDMTE